MCFDKLSTRLNADRHRMLGVEPVGYRRNDLDKVISFIKANPIRAVTFHGGNPITEPRFLEVLTALPSDAAVEIISNGSTLTSAGQDIRPHLERFRRVHVNISLDGTRDTTEYVRVHSKFDDVYQHFTDLRALPNTTVNLHNTITNLNLFDLPAYYAMVLSGQFAEAESISSYVATVPAVHRVSNLPPDLRLQARHRLEDFLHVLGAAGEPAPSHPFSGKVRAAGAYVRNVLRRINAVPYSPRLFAEFLDLTRRTDAFYGFEHPPEYRHYLAAEAAAFPPSIDRISPPDHFPTGSEETARWPSKKSSSPPARARTPANADSRAPSALSDGRPGSHRTAPRSRSGSGWFLTPGSPRPRWQPSGPAGPPAS